MPLSEAAETDQRSGRRKNSRREQRGWKSQGVREKKNVLNKQQRQTPPPAFNTEEELGRGGSEKLLEKFVAAENSCNVSLDTDKS